MPHRHASLSNRQWSTRAKAPRVPNVEWFTKWGGAPSMGSWHDAKGATVNTVPTVHQMELILI